VFRFLRKIPAEKKLPKARIFLTKLKQFISPDDAATKACRRCGTCKHLCCYMKTTKKGSRDVQIS
jgi:hypothetical protein